MKIVNPLKKYGYRPKHAVALLFSTWLLLDLLFTVVSNIKETLLPSVATLPKDGIPISPEFAFGGWQVWVNVVMVSLVIIGVNTLWHLQSAQDRQVKWRYSPMTLFGLLIIWCFTLPAVWHLFQAAYQLLHGRILLAFDALPYLFTVVAQAYLLCWSIQLCGKRHQSTWQKCVQKMRRIIKK